MTSKITDKKHHNNFAALRIFTAVMVIYAHSFPLTGNPDGTILGLDASFLRVRGFFVICGFLITLSWYSDPHFFRYLTKRILRIFPLLILTVFVTAFLIGPLVTTENMSTYFSSPRVWGYLSTAYLDFKLGLPGVFTSNPIHGVNGSLWTLPPEFLLYLLLPAAIFVVRNKLILCLLFVIASAIMLAFPQFYGIRDLPILRNVPLWSVFNVAPYFFAGAIVAILSLQKYFNIYLAFVVLAVTNILPLNGVAEQYWLFFAITYLWLAFGLGSAPVLANAQRFGDPTYGIFLFGFPVQQMLVHYGIFPNNAWMNFLISTTLCTCLGYLSWHLYEKRFIALKPKSRKPERHPEERLAGAFSKSPTQKFHFCDTPRHSPD